MPFSVRLIWLMKTKNINFSVYKEHVFSVETSVDRISCSTININKRSAIVLVEAGYEGYMAVTVDRFKVVLRIGIGSLRMLCRQIFTTSTVSVLVLAFSSPTVMTSSRWSDSQI